LNQWLDTQIRIIIIYGIHRLEPAMFDSNAAPLAVTTPPTGDAVNTREPVHSARVARITSGNLLSGRREIVIEHAGQEYHLRLTRNDKLILTK
jgi:hemin uptake protein HemP